MLTTGIYVLYSSDALPPSLGLHKDLYPKLVNPVSFFEVLQNGVDDNSPYVAVFLLGGHGVMLGLPQNKELAKILHWAQQSDKFVFSICHVPAALLAAQLGVEGEKVFLYRGYKIAAFPDKIDPITPYIGYMPGFLSWKYEEKLTNSGVEVVNSRADKTCHVDRKLITGASPLAANELLKQFT